MRIAVVGSGMAGLTSAYWLKHYGHDVQVIERQPGRRPGGYMIDFFGPGVAVAERMNMIEDLDRIHYQFPALTYIDEEQKELSRLEYPKVRKNLFKGRHWNFLRGDLEDVLFRRVENLVPFRYGLSPIAIKDYGTHVEMELSDGSRDKYDLIVGCDGVNSAVRRLAFSDQDWEYRFLNAHTAAFIDPKGMVEGLSPDALVQLARINATVGVYSLRGGAMSVFFIHDAKEMWGNAPESARRKELHEVHGVTELGREILARMDSVPELFADDVKQVVMKRWSNGRVTLVGDSCWCVSVLGGQGASMAFAGGYIFAQELSRMPLGDAQANYEARCREAIEKRQAGGERNRDFFLPKSNWSITVRNWVSTWVLTSPLAGLLEGTVGADQIPLD